MAIVLLCDNGKTTGVENVDILGVSTKQIIYQLVIIHYVRDMGEIFDVFVWLIFAGIVDMINCGGIIRISLSEDGDGILDFSSQV